MFLDTNGPPLKGTDKKLPESPNFALLRKVPWALFLVVSIVVTLGLLGHCWDYVTYDFPLDDGEGFVLNQAMMLSEGENPYQPIDAPPFIVTNYPPVFIGILAVLVKFFGVKLTLGRILSTIAGLLILMICFLACRQRDVKGPLLPSLIAPALLASTPVIFFWMPLGRIDVFASFLSLTAVYIAWRYPTKAGMYWSLPILWLALYARQSAIEGFIVIAIMLYMQRRQDLLRFVILYLAGALLIFSALYLAYGSEFFKHIWTYTKTRWYFSRLTASYRIIFAEMLLPTAIAIFATWRLWKVKDALPWIIYFIFGFILTVLVGKVGSAQNYFLPMFIPQAILIGIWFTREYNSTETSPALKNALTAGMALLVAYMGFAIGDRYLSFKPTDASRSNGELLVQIVNNFDGPVLIEDEGLTLMAGREVIYTPFIMNELNKEGLWSQAPFLETLQRADYELVILRFNVFDNHHDDTAELGDFAGWDRFSPEMEEAVRENYILAGEPIWVRRSWFLYTRRSGGPSINLIFE